MANFTQVSFTLQPSIIKQHEISSKLKVITKQQHIINENFIIIPKDFDKVDTILAISIKSDVYLEKLIISLHELEII